MPATARAGPLKAGGDERDKERRRQDGRRSEKRDGLKSALRVIKLSSFVGGVWRRACPNRSRNSFPY